MNRRSMKLAVIGIFFLVPLTPRALIHAQGISPVIVEYQGKAKGSFEVRNETIYPFSAVLEPMSFSVDSDGNPRYWSLDAFGCFPGANPWDCYQILDRLIPPCPPGAPCNYYYPGPGCKDSFGYL